MKFFFENKDLTAVTSYGTCLAFDAHLHNHIELVYMMDGRTKAVVDSTECIIDAGDAFIVFPNQIHQYQKIDREHYFITIFTPKLCPEFQHIFTQKVPVSPVIKNVKEPSLIAALGEQIVRINQEKAPLYETKLRGYHLILLSELFQQMQFKEAKVTDGNTLKAILNFCAENYTKDLQLETIARMLHISKYYISHLFSQKLHIGFNEYIGMLRVSDACRLLEIPDKSITEIAYAVGFNSTRTLNRLFLKNTGLTPSRYRKQHSMVHPVLSEKASGTP